MRKLLILAITAFAFVTLVAAPASAQTVITPGPDGTCPAGFSLGYDDDIGAVCTEDISRDPGDPGVDNDNAGNNVTVTNASTLPRTGSDSLPLVQIGAVLVSLGALAVLATRKRSDAVASRS